MMQFNTLRPQIWNPETDSKAKLFTTQGVPHLLFGFECYLTWAVPCT